MGSHIPLKSYKGLEKKKLNKRKIPLFPSSEEFYLLQFLRNVSNDLPDYMASEPDVSIFRVYPEDLFLPKQW
jgi:hypothetical protein